VHRDPRHRVVAKNLPARFCDSRIIKRPDIENNHAGPRSWLLGDRRAAFRAEVPQNRIAAAAEASERFECALDSHRLLSRSDQRGKRAAGEFLAIPAMAHRRARWVGLGRVAHRAAEAAALDLHLDPLALLTSRLKAECCAERDLKSNFLWSRSLKRRSANRARMIREIDMWRVAMLMVKRYAEDAEANADRRADELETEGDQAGAAIWRRVTVPIEQLTDLTGPRH
jgi:hypothetical protein